MPTKKVSGPSRREMTALLGAAAALMGSTRLGWAAAKVAPITIVINQSPWFDSFRKTVELYEKESGNKVELDVNPFEGSLQKQRNSVRASQGQYDLLIMNSGWFAEMYFGGFIEPISDIDPGFKLDPEVYTLGDTVYFDPAKKTMTPAGKLMSMPISPLIPMLVLQRRPLQGGGSEGAGNVRAARGECAQVPRPAKNYGIVQRGARGPHTVAYDFYPYSTASAAGSSRIRPRATTPSSSTTSKGKTALDYYIRLAREAGHPKTASLDQAEVIQNMVTGKAAHIMMVIAAWSQMDDPAKSAVVDKVEFAPPPHVAGVPTAPGLGHWLGGISKNVPDDRKRATVEFLRWFQTKDAQIATAKARRHPDQRRSLS